MVETPNKAPRMRVHLLRLGRVMAVVVLSWERMIVRVGIAEVRLVLLVWLWDLVLFGLVVVGLGVMVVELFE